MPFCQPLLRCWKHSWKPFCESLFSSSVTFLHHVISITKAPSFQCWFQLREEVKIRGSQVSRVWGMLQCCHMFFAKKFLTRSDWCAGALSWRRKQLLVLHFLGAFPSDHILKATKDVSAILWDRNFPHAAIPINYTSKFWALFEATTYILCGILTLQEQWM